MKNVALAENVMCLHRISVERRNSFMDVSIILTMLAVGLILGFVGAGGSGFIISI